MRALGCAAIVALLAAPAHAQRLTIQSDRFAIDGTPKFLVFISYFAAMGAPNVTADLHLLKTLGVDGVRIWPNIDTGPQLMNADGSLRSDELARLTTILNVAKQERLIVDVTFTYEHISGMTPATALVGIANATTALRGYDNLLFDIQNERNVQDRRFMSEEDVGRIFHAIKAIDPSRIATASNSLGDADGPRTGADFTARLGLDVNAFHETRQFDWYTLAVQRPIVQTLRTAGKPVYMQEPMGTNDPSRIATSLRATYFMQAMANAKLSGAAAWCFHTRIAFDFRTGAPFLEDRLRAIPDPEWAFVTALNARIVLRTANGNNYVVAEGGGGAGVRADRTAAGPGSWEVFGVTSVTGGPLIAGDRVAFSTADGAHDLQAVNGGGGALRATSTSVGAFETFTIDKSGGGVIDDGDAVSLRAGDGPWFVVAEGGGGAGVNANSAAAGSWETFRLLFVTPHVADPSGKNARPDPAVRR